MPTENLRSLAPLNRRRASSANKPCGLGHRRELHYVFRTQVRPALTATEPIKLSPVVACLRPGMESLPPSTRPAE
jgi:hypothetical protein